MLTEKDYCDYDTCVALKELGYPTKMTFVSEFGSIEIPINSGLIQLYEAQKWLRHTHNLYISIKPYPCEDGLMWMYEIRRFTPYLVCVIKNKTGFREAEEALSEGIKEAVKILKEKNINQRKALEAENTEFDYGHNVNYNERDTY